MEGTSTETEEKKSIFFAHLKMTQTVEEADAFINETKQKYKGYTNASAYIVGNSGENQRARDNGEPSGTAGLPILESLKKHQLINATAVVSRQWGGTLLGANRLKMFYGGAVDKAIIELGLAEWRLQQKVTLTADYHFNGLIEKEFDKSSWIRLVDIQYGEKVKFFCFIDCMNVNQFEQEVANLTNGTGECNYQEVSYTPYPLDKRHTE